MFFFSENIFRLFPGVERLIISDKAFPGRGEIENFRQAFPGVERLIFQQAFTECEEIKFQTSISRAGEIE